MVEAKPKSKWRCNLISLLLLMILIALVVTESYYYLCTYLKNPLPLSAMSILAPSVWSKVPQN